MNFNFTPVVKSDVKGYKQLENDSVIVSKTTISVAGNVVKELFSANTYKSVTKNGKVVTKLGLSMQVDAANNAIAFFSGDDSNEYVGTLAPMSNTWTQQVPDRLKSTYGIKEGLYRRIGNTNIFVLDK